MMESWTMMITRSVVTRNEMASSRNLWIPTLERGILQMNDTIYDSNYWDCAMPGNPSTQENEIAMGRDSWTPVTPRKPIPQISNTIQADIGGDQMENENWQDLIGIYKDLLQGDALDLNVFQDFSQPPIVENSGNQKCIANTTKKNLSASPSPDHSSNRASNLLLYFRTNDPANWKSNHLETIMGPEKRSTRVSYTNGAQSNSIHSLNKNLIPDPSAQVGSNVVRSTTTGSMLGTQQNQTMTSNQLYRCGYNPTHLQSDSYHDYCHLNLPEPDAASSSTIGSFLSPNNQGLLINNQWVPDVKLTVEGISTPTKDGCENQMVSTRNEDADNQYNELLQAIGDSSSSPILITQKEHIVFEGNKQHIELNKTPEQKTPPKRKKHRPKVVTEWNPKRTPNPKATTNDTSGKSPVKKKYVKKKGIQVLEAQRGKGIEQNSLLGVPRSVRKRKYVRKKGTENLGNQNQQPNSVDAVSAPVVRPLNRSCKRRLNFDLEHVARGESQNLGGSQHGIDLNFNPQDMDQERRISSILDTSALKMTSNQENPFINHKQAGNQTTYFPEPNTPHAKAREHDAYDLASDLTLWNGNNLVNQHVHGGNDNVVIQAGYTSTNVERVSMPMLQHTSQSSASQCALNSDERRGIKRHPFDHIHPCNADGMDSFLVYQRLLLGVEPHSDILESHKSTRTQGEVQALASTESSCMASLADNTRKESRRYNGIYRNDIDLQLLSSTGTVNSSCMVMNVGGNVDNCHFQPPMASPQILYTHPPAERSQRSTQEHDTASVSVISSWNPPPVTPTKEKRITVKPNSTSHRMLQQHCNDAMEDHRPPTVKGRARKHKLQGSIDDLIYMLEGLHIHDAQNMLVPYRGDNSIIPFEPIKKRKPRPKVDLDPESDRVWRLLMGKEGSEGTETLDEDKEKWWEDERRVFHGRVDSFIARMHLVQGDRRFSQWKGSVVDSVIGVFLTQNVTDHLSSSAFMSLAARFPPKPRTENQSSCQDGACVPVKEPIEIAQDSIKCQENIAGQPALNQSSFVSCISATKKNDTIPEEEVILSQDSADSSIIQIIDEIRSISGSNSEAEDQTTGFKTSKESGLPVQAESIPLWPSFDSAMTEAYRTSNETYQQSEIRRYQTSPLSEYDFLSDHLSHQENLQPGLDVSCRQHLNNNHQQGKDLFAEKVTLPETLVKGKYDAERQDSDTFKETTLNFEDRISIVANQNCLEQTAAEASSKEQNYASNEPLNGMGTNVSKERKEIVDDEKKRAFDWDSLRKQVLLNSENKERSKDAADSIDYEAMRHAHVNEISDAIRERGMNNMLAARMKDFLNRLARDHGCIDLEWLRDIPPDKAKDYLLSIRGLGLKSVECVRLLTLHHLAFPVDTNVGRIAVRLGWVPLQPLPESLQLHLLEMYPVLESIQKYLWPRLCKLDRLTLYELHYQMITFGKVFCTKSKPNCNACPMRAECRHFASAFASARLALPGPEEKRMVSSDVPITTDTTLPVFSRLMALPPADNVCNNEEGCFGRHCAPIIEEPTTPEPEAVELSISDIEDQYYEDSDEIPTIKLNMEEFTTNLQNVMHDSIEFQGDMSKALVALSPEAASIPAPKLKNVSRLRTEHQVYELPDSHPLLEGLDKREPDDPSPYLLAIWTPGETANSINIPESGCIYQESGQLCNRTTCFSCNSIREANSQMVRGTILIPCRTAMRGGFPLNGTYFQVNEVFADHASSLNPIDVPREWIWNLPRRTVYFGTSVSTIFKGLTTEGIQYCFWRGFVCVRGFDQKTRAPRPLMARLHFPASKTMKQRHLDEQLNKDKPPG